MDNQKTSTLILGDSLDKLREMEGGSISALITDPPYSLRAIKRDMVSQTLNTWTSEEGGAFIPSGRGFEGRDWDGWVPPPDLWSEVFRVMKEGAHGLVFGGSRTFDLLTISLRLSGFEVRDCIMWIYGVGFPTGLSISQGIDKRLGVEREVVGESLQGASNGTEYIGRINPSNQTNKSYTVTRATSEEAKKFDDWGTTLRPSFEPIILVRKPFKGSVVDNVLKHGTGGINLGATRFDPSYSHNWRTGRHPSNVIIDEEVEKLLGPKGRFFYSSKASRAERDAGLEGRNHHPTVKPLDLMRYLVRMITPPDGVVLDPFSGSGSTLIASMMEGFESVGIEREEGFIQIAESRLQYWREKGDQDG
jgi:site-specific DNA-methyltransferase (adenine-specific)